LPRIAAGDERAVRECVHRYGALVWSLARRWCADRTDSEDAVQEVFIDLWRTAHRFDMTRASEAGWVAMIARRRLIDRARRRQTLPTTEPFPADFDLEDDTSADAESVLDRATRAEQARAVLRALPATQRRLLELSLLDGKTHDEIARETALPLGTVKSHIRRGLLRARAMLLAPLQPLREESTS
jgi:RNA polymerase sigma-70 factor (ECF subfamily)